MQVLDVTKQQHFCKQCALSQICLPMGLSPEEIERLDSLIGKNIILNRKDHLFRKREKFYSIFAVRSGSIKTYSTDIEGQEHVLGFHFPGEVLGLNALHLETYHCNAVALETTNICAIPFDNMTLLAQTVPNLLKQILKIMSKEIATETLYLGDYTAEERLAAFLVNLSLRFKARGLSERNFILSMSRGDIANYLRMATETVSRLLARFQKVKLLKIVGRQVEIVNAIELGHLGRCILS